MPGKIVAGPNAIMVNLDTEKFKKDLEEMKILVESIRQESDFYVLETNLHLTEQQHERLNKAWKDLHGEKAPKLAIIESGFKLKKMSSAPTELNRNLLEETDLMYVVCLDDGMMVAAFVYHNNAEAFIERHKTAYAPHSFKIVLAHNYLNGLHDA